MVLELGYGMGVQKVDVPDKNLMGVLVPNDIEKSMEWEQLVRRALDEPIGTGPLRSILSPEDKIVIVTSDITRPMPTSAVMPLLLDELYALGTKPENITLVFALGIHRGHTEQERIKLAGERAFKEIRCVDSGSQGFVSLGKTTSGTPLDICRIVAEADRRICLGNIEYHYFAGYSGGAKAIMPGVATRDTIEANHSMMTHPKARAGVLEGNPIRSDIEEIIPYCHIDFILNVVLDEHKKIVCAVAGHSIEAHREGCRFLDKMYRVKIDRPADIVIASQGGHPKDINLYQTQKALDNANYAVRDGGIIILAGACGEGMGEDIFERWMDEAKSPQDLIDRIERQFELGGHKAAAIALVQKRAEVFLVSEMAEDKVRKMFMRPFSSIQKALEDALAEIGENATVLVMPYGGSTMPTI